jgi:hypothetical protein
MSADYGTFPRQRYTGEWGENGYEREADLRGFRFGSFAEFRAQNYPEPEPLLGERGKILLAVGSFLLVYGSDGAAKSTWTIDAAAHLAAGRDWLGIKVPRPVRCLLIENEGPAGLYQAKLDHKQASWEGEDFTDNWHVLTEPWGEFSFADEEARAALREYCDENAVELVLANPTLGLGASGAGKPEETAQFVDWLRECGLWAGRAFWLIHHENKAGQISGDWGRHPDTKVLLQKDGNAQRTKLTWEKTRWATLAPEEKAVMLEWITETEGYSVTPLATTESVSDDVLAQRIVSFLIDHPAAPSTRELESGVKGTAKEIRRLLNERSEFDWFPGQGRAKHWMLAASASEGASEWRRTQA